ncbi:MAG: tetratricopeptide repeat protein [Ekhidna sp.]
MKNCIRIFLFGGTLLLMACTEEFDIPDPSQVEAIHQQTYQLFKTDLDSAMILADSSLALALESEVPLEVANSYYIKGYIFKKKDDLAQAFIMYLNAAKVLDVLTAENAEKMNCDVLLNIGETLRKFYRYDEAIHSYEVGFSLETIDDACKQKLHYNKGLALKNQGNLTEAMESLKQSANIANSIQDISRVLKSFNLLGLVHKDAGHYPEARAYYQFIIDHPKASTKYRSMAYQNMAVSYLEENQSPIAKQYLIVL